MRATISRVLACLAFLGAMSAPGGTRADYLVTDLSERRIDITTGFAGADVLLFGSTDPGGDVVVVIRGPDQPVVVRRKERMLGIWINRDWMLFDRVPSFYYVASSRPLDEIASPALLAKIRVGLDYLSLPIAGGSAGLASPHFREALIHTKQEEGLYGTTPGKVTFLGGRLFRTTVHFPANVATGGYKVEVYLIRDGRVETAQLWPLFITKVGLSAQIYDHAHTDAALYGIVAVLMATVAGWLGALGFRRT